MGPATDGIGSLLSGIVRDLQQLVAAQLRLARHEVAAELSKARSAALAAGVGLGLIGVGGLMLVIMLVHLLATTGLPLWACYGIVGTLLGIGGGLLLVRSRARGSDVSIVPRRTIETFRQNATWIRQRARSIRT